METQRVDTLRGRLAAASALIGAVPKTGYNSFHKYAYPTEADVVGACRKAMSQHGITVTCKSVTERYVRESATKYDGTMQNVYAKFTFEIGANGCSETLLVEVWAGGQDAAEKADLKALTSAKKYCYMQVFALAIGDTEDNASKLGDGEAQQMAVDQIRGEMADVRKEAEVRFRMIERIVRNQYLRCAPSLEEWSGGDLTGMISALPTAKMKEYGADIATCCLVAQLEEWVALLNEHVVADAAASAALQSRFKVAEFFHLSHENATAALAAAKDNPSGFFAIGNGNKR